MMPRRRPATCFVRGNTRPPLLSSAVALPSRKLPKSAPGAVIMATKALLPALTTGGPRPIPLAPIGRSWRKRRRPALARPGVIVWAGLLSARATTTTSNTKGRVKGTTWAGFTGTPVPTATAATPPGKAALGRPPARKRFGAPGGRGLAALLPSFPRKRESREGLPRLRHYKEVPSGFPLTREGRFLSVIAAL